MERTRLVFKNTPWGDKILNPLVMEPWNYDGWLAVLKDAGCKPEPPPFVPTFLSAVVISGDRGEIRQPIGIASQENFISYFATKETADALAKRFGGEVVEVQYGLESMAHTVPANCFAIKFPSGKLFNAGVLASFFVRMPENEFPLAAEKAVLLTIAK